MNTEIGRNPGNRIFHLRSNFSRLLISQQTGSFDIQRNVWLTTRANTSNDRRRRRRRRCAFSTDASRARRHRESLTSNLTPHWRTYAVGLSHVCTASVPLTNLLQAPPNPFRTLGNLTDSSLSSYPAARHVSPSVSQTRFNDTSQNFWCIEIIFSDSQSRGFNFALDKVRRKIFLD